MSKYHAQKTTVFGITFDSKKEAERYLYLRSLLKRGEIQNLQRQVKFVLIPTQRDENGKLLEKERSYYADFVYYQNGQMIVEDVKGMKTELYKLKRALMLKVHKIRIKEV